MIGSAAVVAALLAALWLVAGSRPETDDRQHFWQFRDRADAVGRAASAIGVLALARAVGPWASVPPAVWGLSVAVAVLGLALTGWRWAALAPVAPGATGRWYRFAAAVEVAVAAALVALTV